MRDVAAHLTMQQLTIWDGLRLALRHPPLGGMNRMIHTFARGRSGMPTEQMIAEIRGMVGSRRHNVGITPFETLIDIVVHGQDIAVPLGRSLPVPPEVSATAASRVWDYQSSRGGRRTASVFKSLPYDGLHMVATDTDWSVGEGPELRGPVLSLLLLLTGRQVVLPELAGPGAAVLTERLAAVRSRV